MPIQPCLSPMYIPNSAKLKIIASLQELAFKNSTMYVLFAMFDTIQLVEKAGFVYSATIPNCPPEAPPRKIEIQIRKLKLRVPIFLSNVEAM